MFLTKASEYAFFGLMNLDGCDKPKDIETISSELKISKSFLAKILQNLARAGILRSFKGIKGGFCLARSAEEITVKEILDAVESKKTRIFICEAKLRKMCGEYRKMGCNVCEVFGTLQLKFDDFLSQVTLRDLIRKECACKDKSDKEAGEALKSNLILATSKCEENCKNDASNSKD